MRDMIKDALILLAITLLSGLILGVVYEVTKEPIEKQQKQAQEDACREVFAMDGVEISFEDIDLDTLQDASKVLTDAGYTSDEIERILTAKDQSGEILGYVTAVTSHEGYGGDIRIYVGVTKDGVTKGISILEISETPGLGMRAQEVLKPQFDGRAADLFVYTKSGAGSESEIDAISGATITTNAVTNAVNSALSYLYSQDLVTMSSQSGAQKVGGEQ